MGRRKRKSRNELKPGFSRHKSALEQHIGSHKLPKKSRLKTWKRRDTESLKRWLFEDTEELRGLRPISFKQVKLSHARLLDRRSYRVYVLEAFELVYRHTRGRFLVKLTDQIKGPEHEHALIPLSKRALEASSQERRHLLEALARLEHPAACDVAEFLFSRFGRGTQIACAKVFGTCGTRKHLHTVETFLEDVSRFHKDTIESLEHARELLLERFPEDALLATQGSLSVSAMGDQAGALSLNDEERAHMVFDVQTEMQRLLNAPASGELARITDEWADTWFDLRAPPRRVPWYARAAQSWTPRGRWLILSIIFMGGLLAPGLVLSAMCVAIGVTIATGMWFETHRGRWFEFVRHAHLVEGQIDPTRGKEGHMAKFRARKGRFKSFPVTVPKRWAEQEGVTSDHVSLLWHEERGELMCAVEADALAVTEQGHIVARHTWKLGILGFFVLTSLLQVLVLAGGFL